jgi:hypothetical protein
MKSQQFERAFDSLTFDIEINLFELIGLVACGISIRGYIGKIIV